MLIRRRKKEDADDIVTRVGDYNNAAALNYEPRDIDRKSTRLNSSHSRKSRMPSSA